MCHDAAPVGPPHDTGYGHDPPRCSTGPGIRRTRGSRRAYAPLPPSGQSKDTAPRGATATSMIGDVHGPVPTRLPHGARALTLTALVSALLGIPAGGAAADACAYASTGPSGIEAVAVAGSLAWPTLPPCPPTTPPPDPSPAPEPPPPAPTPTPTPSPSTTPNPSPTPSALAPSPPEAPAAPSPRERPPRPRPVPPPPSAAPSPRAPTPPSPAPRRAAEPTPHARLSPVRYPEYRSAPPPPRRAGRTTAPLVFVLLIAVPAVVVVAALRPR